MKIKSRSKEENVIMEMNTTPLIDVMLVLLVMLIITIPTQLHSIGMNMPVPKPNDNKHPPIVVKIDLDENGKIYWDGQGISNIDELEHRLTKTSAIPDQPEIHIKPSQKTHYKYLASVMAAAQRHGLNKIGVVGNERFVQE
jgi:biopolymer transport protein ExbD